MLFKICSKCKENKSLSDYYQRKSGPRSGSFYEKCKDCMKIRGRLYFRLNHTRQLFLVKKRTKRYLLSGLEYLAKSKNSECVDCGKYYPPWVMEFDHFDSKTKVNNVAWLRRFHKIDNLKNEIAKCDLVCANCHRIRTFRKSLNKNYIYVIKKLEVSGYKFNWK